MLGLDGPPVFQKLRRLPWQKTADMGIHGLAKALFASILGTYKARYSFIYRNPETGIFIPWAWFVVEITILPFANFCQVDVLLWE